MGECWKYFDQKLSTFDHPGPQKLYVNATNLLAHARFESVQAAQIFCASATMQKDIAGRPELAASIFECPRAQRKFTFRLPIILVRLVKPQQVAVHFGVDELVINRERVRIQRSAGCCVELEFLSGMRKSQSRMEIAKEERAHHISSGAHVTFQRRAESLFDALDTIIVDGVVAEPWRFIVNELAEQLSIRRLLRSIPDFSVKILFVLIVHFRLVPITTVDAINIQNSFQLPMGLRFLILLIVHAVNRRAVNVVVDRIPRLLHVELVAFVVERVLRVLAAVIVPALLELRDVEALLLLMVLLQRQANCRRS